MARDFDELLDAYMDQEKLYRMEGRRGLENLCKVVSAIGYKDQQYFGQLSSGAAIGDLVCFLEDNPGAIEAIYTWIRNSRYVPEWQEALENEVQAEDEE